MRLALGLAYDGTSYSGWQTQPDGSAVQDEVERSLAALAGHPVSTLCAGRTDAGVHALQQVIHLDSDADRPLSAWVRGTNARLGPGVAVQWARPVSDAFHARFSARSRSYRYLILCSPVPHPLWVHRAGWVFRPLDEGRMQAAAACLLGEHDFSAFRSSQCQAASPVRTVSAIDVKRRSAFVEVSITANAFLHHMVRNIVGALVEVGVGRQPQGWLADVLAAGDRSRAAPTFSPAGLYLAGVDYDPAHGLPCGVADPLAPQPALPAQPPIKEV